MLLRKAMRFRRLVRLNLFDGWQVLGTLGVIVGTFAVAILPLSGRHVLPSTSSTIHLLQTFLSEPSNPRRTAEPTPQPSPSPEAVVAPANPPLPQPSRPRSGIRPSHAPVAPLTPSATTSPDETPLPTDTALPTLPPTPRPSIDFPPTPQP